MNYYELADIVTGTLFNERKKKIVNIDPTLLRDYPAANRLVRKNLVREQGGLDHRWRVNVVGNTGATHFGAWHTAVRTQGDHLKTASMQLRGTKNSFSFDALEPEFNGGEYEVVDVIKNREHQAKIGLTAQIETDSWSYVNQADEETPQGMLYWLPYCSGTGGFVGTGSGDNTTSVAGLNPATYTGWKSWGAAYVAVTYDDLILKMRNAYIDTNFKAPINPMLVMDGIGHSWAIYVNKDTILEFEDKARDQNENLGPDVASMMGRAMFGRIPLEEVPTLGTTLQSFSTRSPVFGVNWGAIENRVRKNWWMKEDKVSQDPDQPLTVSYDIYCFNQMVMLDRRRGGFNIAKAA